MAWQPILIVSLHSLIILLKICFLFSGYSDESEVNWAQLDRNFNLFAAASRKLSKFTVLLIYN